MKIAALASLVLTAAAMVPATATPLARASSVSLVPTATKAYTAVEYQDFGRVGAQMPMHVVVGLALRNSQSIDGILSAQVTPGSGMYGIFLSPAQTLKEFSPTGAQVSAVAHYLAAKGFTNIQATADNVAVTADGTSASVSAAFATQIDNLLVAGQNIYANVLPAYVPSSLGGIVVAVEGLNNFTMSPLSRVPAVRAVKRTALAAASGGCTQVPLLGLCVQTTFGPQALATVYDAAGAATGASTKVAIVAAGDLAQVKLDLRAFEAFYNLPQVPYEVIATGPPSADTSGTPEWDMDTQYSTGFAGTVRKLLIYDAPSLTDADTTVAFSRFESADIAKAASASFGSCEIFPAMDGTLAVDDEIFALAALHGQTLFAAAGDNGTTCPVAYSTGVPITGLPMQSYPASSPYAVGVGGTTVLANPDYSYNAEVTWIGTGGGTSIAEKSPFWQRGVVPGISGFKAVPDIAMDADPNTGADVIVGGQHTTLGGTSLAAPLALGAWARIESQQPRVDGLGFAAPLFYKQFADLRTAGDAVPPPGALTQAIGGFHDILVGTNGLPAFPEFDYTTGLGTLDTTLQIGDIGS